MPSKAFRTIGWYKQSTEAKRLHSHAPRIAWEKRVWSTFCKEMKLISSWGWGEIKAQQWGLWKTSWKEEKAVPENWWKLGLSVKEHWTTETGIKEKKKGVYGQINEAGWDEKSEVEQRMGLVVKEKSNIWERRWNLVKDLWRRLSKENDNGGWWWQEASMGKKIDMS